MLKRNEFFFFNKRTATDINKRGKAHFPNAFFAIFDTDITDFVVHLLQIQILHCSNYFHLRFVKQLARGQTFQIKV
jgi:hypothetical protein